MWKQKTFKTQAAFAAWKQKNAQRVQWEEIFINNGWGVEYRPLRTIGDTDEPMQPTIIRLGDKGRGIMPHSEVCMHMRVADKAMDFRLIGGAYPMVQLLRDDGSAFSAPILPGEAGVYRDERGFFYYYFSE